jgi:N-acetylmuramoyl-L-alanine amidase
VKLIWVFAPGTAAIKKMKIQYVIAIFLLSMILCGGPCATSVLAADDETQRPVVVLDPGHGGHDPGGQGPEGSLEKKVTLALARSITRHLGEAYRVILTRTDDVHLDTYGRTAKANYNRADLFISLHTGGSPLRTTRGINIFYYQVPARFLLHSDSEGKQTELADPLATPWHEVQLIHVTESRQLAEILQKTLQAMPSKPSCHIQSGPMAVLQGAAMPAVLLELGYLTNPIEEKELSDPEMLSAYAETIAEGIETFLLNRLAQNPKP